MLPLEVERHRRWSDRFIVGLAHANADNIVGVADHFLVVEANRIETSPRPSPTQASYSRSSPRRRPRTARNGGATGSEDEIAQAVRELPLNDSAI
jgi:hypothetical protein